MLRTKEGEESGSNLDAIFQESININNLYLSKTPSSIESIQRFFNKSIKLRNVSKKTFWNRKMMQSNLYTLRSTDLLPCIQGSKEITTLISNYIFKENGKEMILGQLTINTERKYENCFYFDSIATHSHSSNSDKNNCLVNPKLICNKDEKKEKSVELIESAYKRWKGNKTFFELFFAFSRGENLNNDILTSKIYTIFPNVNFELKQIKNLSFSNTVLNKYLVSKTYQMENNNFDTSKLKNGFFTMSQEHRLIAWRDDTKDNGGWKNSKSWKQIIWGIWLNFKEECPRPKIKELDEIIAKHKFEIYSKCFEYVELSSKIDSVYSPSPDRGVFWLVLFYQGMQCHYEVTLHPNEEDQAMNDQENTELNSFGNNWWIAKNKKHISASEAINVQLGNEIRNSSVITMSDYWSKKTGMNQRSFLTKSTNTKQATSKVTSGVNYEDNWHEIFDSSNLEIDDDMDDIYNYPWIMEIKTASEGGSNTRQDKKEVQRLMNERNDSNAFEKKNSSDIKNNTMNANNTNNSLEKCCPWSNTKNKFTSWLSSKNSQKTVSNTKANTNYATNNIPGQYTAIISEQTESIKKLQIQVTKLESNIKNLLDCLWKQKMREHDKLKEKDFNKIKKIKMSSNEANQLNSPENPSEESFKLPDTSVKIPKIVWQESIMTFDEDESVV